ncbi:FecR family protein [Chitinophaga cymbidii]|nr:FecR family protein [Chitinophaga cymbidii]
MPVTDRLRYLLRSYIDGSSTPAELQELSDLLPTVEDDVLEELVDEEYEVIKLLGARQDADWNRLFNNIVRSPRSRSRWWQYAAAAAVVLGIAGSAYYFAQRPEKEAAPLTQSTPVEVQPARSGAVLTLSNGQQIVLDSAADGNIASQGSTQVSKVNGRLVYSSADASSREIVYNTVSTPRGRHFQLELPDGTRVWLNALSSLKYPNVFNDGERSVTLQGEGYFDVAKDAAKPFRVKVNGQTIEVLGTGFNVQAYTSTIVTTLIEGAVSVNNGNSRTALKPGQQAVSNDQSIQVRPADMQKAVAWKEGEFRFRSDDMSNIMDQLSHWYDIDVRYTGKLPEKRYSGSISRHAKIEEVLEMLHVLTGARFELKDAELTVIL